MTNLKGILFIMTLGALFFLPSLLSNGVITPQISLSSSIRILPVADQKIPNNPQRKHPSPNSVPNLEQKFLEEQNIVRNKQYWHSAPYSYQMQGYMKQMLTKIYDRILGERCVKAQKKYSKPGDFQKFRDASEEQYEKRRSWIFDELPKLVIKSISFALRQFLHKQAETQFMYISSKGDLRFNNKFMESAEKAVQHSIEKGQVPMQIIIQNQLIVLDFWTWVKEKPNLMFPRTKWGYQSYLKTFPNLKQQIDRFYAQDSDSSKESTQQMKQKQTKQIADSRLNARQRSDEGGISKKAEAFNKNRHKQKKKIQIKGKGGRSCKQIISTRRATGLLKEKDRFFSPQELPKIQFRSVSMPQIYQASRRKDVPLFPRLQKLSSPKRNDPQSGSLLNIHLPKDQSVKNKQSQSLRIQEEDQEYSPQLPPETLLAALQGLKRSQKPATVSAPSNFKEKKITDQIPSLKPSRFRSQNYLLPDTQDVPLLMTMPRTPNELLESEQDEEEQNYPIDISP